MIHGEIDFPSHGSSEDDPPPAYENTTKEHAKCIMDVVVADNPIGRRPV